MKYLTATQAATRLGKSEKTIRRWIEEGKLVAHHPQGRKNLLAIAESDVEHLVAELSQYEQVPEADQDIANLVERVTRLEQEVSELRSLLSARATMATEPLERVAAEQKRKTYAPRATGSTEPTEGIPAGSLLIAEFAERHHVNQRTFRDHIVVGKKGEKVEVIERMKPGRESRGETERWLSPEQQQRVIAFWRRHGTHFEECKDSPECPCRSLSTP